MKDATLSEKIIKFKSLLKEVIDIDKNIKTTNEGDVEKLKHLLHDIHLELDSRYNFPFRK